MARTVRKPAARRFVAPAKGPAGAVAGEREGPGPRARARAPIAVQPVARQESRRYVTYEVRDGIYGFVRKIRVASPMDLVETERFGVKSRLIKDLAGEMEIAASRLYEILRVSKATIESKASRDEVVSGAGGQAALGVVRLLGIAQEIVEKSTAAEAREFDVAKWLGEWIQRPQPALGGRRPADLLDTPTGFEIVARTLGALESGSYL